MWLNLSEAELNEYLERQLSRLEMTTKIDQEPLMISKRTAQGIELFASILVAFFILFSGWWGGTEIARVLSQPSDTQKPVENQPTRTIRSLD